ncbi:MAG: 3-deoxy-D-manno-octulosonic acid transferase [Candidatus Omnitrophica bacterium]|nr:3-deoxy-D-manno-octulosonic acid transferase [Candidatus Omnitrophota bacterium]
MRRWVQSRREAPGFSARLGIYPRELAARFKGRRPVWIQAVSVGEVNALKSFVAAFRLQFPDERLAISTTTVTGQVQARGLVSGQDTAFYFPLDLGPIVRRAVGMVNPKLFLMVETEVWPSLIDVLKKREVPVAVVNGRISDRSFAAYLKLARWVSPVFKKIDLFLMRTGQDAERAIRLGAPPHRVQVVGNLKFDNILTAEEAPRGDAGVRIKEMWKDSPIWVAGSIHPREADILVEAYAELVQSFSDLKWVVAPRHIETAGHIERALRRRKIPSARWSQIGTNGADRSPRAVIVDTYGDLISFYQAADVVFIGGSLVPKGGQNPIEAAQFAKPIIFGPYVSNFSDVYERLKANGAGFVASRGDLGRVVRTLLDDRARLEEAGRRARTAVEGSRGACARTLEALKDFIHGS